MMQITDIQSKIFCMFFLWPVAKNRNKFAKSLFIEMNTCVHHKRKDLYIFAFGEYNSKQVNVSGIQHFLAQF